MANSKEEARLKRKLGIRKKISGNEERPRLTIFRSNKHIYAQVVDDTCNKVLVTAGTVGKELSDSLAKKKKMDQAKLVGSKIAQKCKQAGISKVVFDRTGYRYHGRVMALANAAREAGLQF